MLLVSASIIGVRLFAAQAKIAKVDVQKVAGGYRASKVIGSNVLNDANVTSGKIDDLLVTRESRRGISCGYCYVLAYRGTRYQGKAIVLPNWGPSW
jgi:hypothetical protein